MANEALATIGWKLDREQHGSVYHITWSLAQGREAIESNDVLRARGWTSFDLPMPIRLKPARWP